MLKITPPRNKKTKSFYIRGSYLGVKVDESCRTERRSLARKVLARIQGEIERGDYRKAAADREQRLTFLDAAIGYMEAGKSRRYVPALIKYFGETPVDEIDQAAIDRTAMALHPHVTNATRNTYVYTPVSAILRHAGRRIPLARPPGAKGRIITDWIGPDDAFGIIGAADTFDPEFATLLAFLLYTGPRITAALQLQRDDLDVANKTAWARPQKGQQNHAIVLHEDLCARLAVLLASHERRRVFRLRYGGHLQHLLRRSLLVYLGLPCPVRPEPGWRPPRHRLSYVTFHIWRHTWATWMRRFGGATRDDLADSGNWKDPRSANRYVHAAPAGIWKIAAALPAMCKVGES